MVICVAETMSLSRYKDTLILRQCGEAAIDF